jgi:predicted DNA-binding transcriptional regulator AlpA
MTPSNALPQNFGARRLSRLPEVLSALGGINKTTLYALIRDGRFPPPIKIGGTSCWPSHEVDAWVDSCPRGTVARRKPSGC